MAPSSLEEYNITFFKRHGVRISLILYLPPLSPPLQEAAWTISNITAGQPNQIQAVIDMGLIPPLVQIMMKVGHCPTD